MSKIPARQYQFQDPQVERIIKKALSEAWNPYEDIAWKTPVQPEALFKNTRSVLELLPDYQKLSETQKQQIKLKESVYHICNLLAGEHSGVSLAGQILLGVPQDTPDWPYFVSTLLSDERNHVIALTKYLDEKIGTLYAPHPRIRSTLDTLYSHKAYEIKLFVGQVVLEWTATSLITAIVSKHTEPLLAEILRKIIRDEGRHLVFNRIVFQNLKGYGDSIFNRETTDLLFESIVACISSLCAIPVWQEYGFKRESCQEYAFKEMQARGVLHFYQNILPKELYRCGFKSDRLYMLLEKELPNRIMNDHWSYEPKVLESPTEQPPEEGEADHE